MCVCRSQEKYWSKDAEDTVQQVLPPVASLGSLSSASSGICSWPFTVTVLWITNTKWNSTKCYVELRSLPPFYYTLDEIIQNALGLERYYVTEKDDRHVCWVPETRLLHGQQHTPVAQPNRELMIYTPQWATQLLNGGTAISLLVNRRHPRGLPNLDLPKVHSIPTCTFYRMVPLNLPNAGTFYIVLTLNHKIIATL